MARNLSQQQADTKVGAALLLLSIVLQLINLFPAIRIGDFKIYKEGVILALVCWVLISFLAFQTSNFLAKKTNQKANTILKEAIK